MSTAIIDLNESNFFQRSHPHRDNSVICQQNKTFQPSSRGGILATRIKNRLFQCITHEEYFDSPPQRGTELLKETAAAAEGYAPPKPLPPTQAMPLLPTPPTDEPYLRLRREREEAEEGQGAKELRFGLRKSLYLTMVK